MSSKVPGFDELTFADEPGGPKPGTYGWALTQPNTAQYGIKGLSSYVYALLHKNKLLPDHQSYNKTFSDRFGKYVQEYVDTGTTSHPLLKPALDKLRKKYPADKWTMEFGRGSIAADRSFNYDITFQHKKRGFFDTFAITDKEQLTATQAVAMSMAGPGLGQLRQIGFFNPFLKEPFQTEDALRTDQIRHAVFADHSITKDPNYAPISSIIQKGTKPSRIPKGFNGNKSFVSLDFETAGKTGRPGVLGWSLARYDYDKRLDDWIMRRMDNRFYYPTTKDILNPEYDEAQSVTHLDPTNIARLRGDKAHYSQHWNEHERKVLLHKIGNMPILTMNGAQFDLNILTGRNVGQEFTAYDELKGGAWDLQHLAEAQRGRGKGRNTLDRLYKMATGFEMEDTGLAHHDPRSDVIAAATILRELRLRHKGTRMGQAAAQLLATKGSYTQSRSGMLPEDVLEEIVLDRKAHKADTAGGLGKMTPTEDALGITEADKEAGLTADDFEQLDLASEITDSWKVWQENLRKMGYDPATDSFVNHAWGRSINTAMNKPRTPGRGNLPTKSKPGAFDNDLEYFKSIAKDLNNDDWGSIPKERQWGRSSATAAQALFKRAAHDFGYKGSKYYAVQRIKANKFWNAVLPVSTGVSGSKYADVKQAQADIVFGRGTPTPIDDSDRYQAWLAGHQTDRSASDIQERRDVVAERRAAALADSRNRAGLAIRGDWKDVIPHANFHFIDAFQKSLIDSTKAIKGFGATLEVTSKGLGTVWSAGNSAYNGIESASSDLFSAIPGLSTFNRARGNFMKAVQEQGNSYIHNFKSRYLDVPYGIAKGGVQGFLQGGVPGLVGGMLKGGAQGWFQSKADRITGAAEHAQSVIHLWSMYSELIFAPLKVAANGLRVSFNLLSKQFLTGLRDMSSVGLPLTALTGQAYPAYQYAQHADRLFRLSEGSSANALATLENRSQSLFSMGQVDSNHIVASALLGVFGDAYAADGNTESHYTSMMNSVAARLRSASSPRERARIMTLAGKVDSSMPNRLQGMLEHGITNYNDMIDGTYAERRRVYFRGIQPDEAANFRDIDYDWNMIQDQFKNSRMRLVASVWDWAKGLFNAGNRVLDLLSQRRYKEAGGEIKNAAVSLWKRIQEVWSGMDINLGDVWDKIKAGFKTAIDWAMPYLLDATVKYVQFSTKMIMGILDAVKGPLGNFITSLSSLRLGFHLEDGKIRLSMSSLAYGASAKQGGTYAAASAGISRIKDADLKARLQGFETANKRFNYGAYLKESSDKYVQDVWHVWERDKDSQVLNHLRENPVFQKFMADVSDDELKSAFANRKYVSSMDPDGIERDFVEDKRGMLALARLFRTLASTRQKQYGSYSNKDLMLGAGVYDPDNQATLFLEDIDKILRDMSDVLISGVKGVKADWEQRSSKVDVNINTNGEHAATVGIDGNNAPTVTKTSSKVTGYSVVSVEGMLQFLQRKAS